MTCLFDPVNCILGLIPQWAWWALGIFAALFVIGVLWRLKDFLALIHRIASWPGVAAIVGAVAVALAVFWPKKRREASEPQENLRDGSNDAKRRDDFVFPRTTTPRPRGARRFNPDTNTWEDI